MLPCLLVGLYRNRLFGLWLRTRMARYACIRVRERLLESV